MRELLQHVQEDQQDILQDAAVLTETICLNEGFRGAKERFVDTKQMTLKNLKALAEKDPTPQKKYIEWMAKVWVNSRMRPSMLNSFDILAEFEDLVKKNKIDQADINRYNSPQDVEHEVHAAHMRMGEESRQKKEAEVRQTLIDLGGSAERTYKYLTKKHYVDPSKPEFVSREFVEEIRKRMAAEEAGKEWKNFTIDEDILDHIDPADVLKETPYVYVIEVKSRKKSQFYGRNMWYDKNDPQSKTSFWCTSYTTDNCMWNNYAFYSGEYSQDPEEAKEAEARGNRWRSGSMSRFYIIIPKDIKYVPDKKWAKANVQVTEHGLNVWDTDDRSHSMNEAEVQQLFKSWQLPLGKKKTEAEA